MGDVKLALSFLPGVDGVELEERTVLPKVITPHFEFSEPLMTAAFFTSSGLREIYDPKRSSQGLITEDAGIINYGDIGFKYDPQKGFWSKLTHVKLPEISFLVATSQGVVTSMYGPYVDIEECENFFHELDRNSRLINRHNVGIYNSIKMIAVSNLVYLNRSGYNAEKAITLLESNDKRPTSRRLLSNGNVDPVVRAKLQAIGRADKRDGRNLKR